MRREVGCDCVQKCAGRGGCYLHARIEVRWRARVIEQQERSLAPGRKHDIL